MILLFLSLADKAKPDINFEAVIFVVLLVFFFVRAACLLLLEVVTRGTKIYYFCHQFKK